MKAEDLDRLENAMLKETLDRNPFGDRPGDYEKVAVDVLRRHIAALEGRQSELTAVSLAINDALAKLWWGGGTEARRKIREVADLAKKLREP